MTISEDIKMLSKDITAAEDHEIARIAEIKAESRATIESLQNRLMEEVLEPAKRYHRFKSELWNAGEHITVDPLWNVLEVNVDALVFDMVYEAENVVVFKDTSHESSGFYFAVPLDYFDDPDRWEKELLEWIENIHAMEEKAPSIIFQDCTYTASTLGLRYPGNYFYLKEKNADGKHSATYTVNYDTGTVYDSPLKDIKVGKCNPIGDLR